MQDEYFENSNENTESNDYSITDSIDSSVSGDELTADFTADDFENKNKEAAQRLKRVISGDVNKTSQATLDEVYNAVISTPCALWSSVLWQLHEAFEIRIDHDKQLDIMLQELNSARSSEEKLQQFIEKYEEIKDKLEYYQLYKDSSKIDYS